MAGVVTDNMPIGTSVIFYDYSKRVLLYRRDNINSIKYPDKWDLLGGLAENNETPEQAISRELFEEIEYTEKKPQLFKRYNFYDRVEYTFCIEDQINIKTTPLHEGQYLKWFKYEEVAKMSEDMIAFGFHKVLCDFFKEYC